ncbi:hypothetical protein D9M68_934610 [compost metagenome]
MVGSTVLVFGGLFRIYSVERLFRPSEIAGIDWPVPIPFACVSCRTNRECQTQSVGKVGRYLQAFAKAFLVFDFDLAAIAVVRRSKQLIDEFLVVWNADVFGRKPIPALPPQLVT